jgi:hypothetical protein
MASSDWKKKNYNKNIKVSQSVVDQLKKRSKSENIALANRTDASPQFKEAVRRFYGKPATGTTRPTGKITPRSRGTQSTPSKASAPSKPKSKAGMGGRATVKNPQGTSMSSVTSESYKMNVDRNYKAPASYKPLSTGAKLGMVASAVPAGRAAMAAGKAIGLAARGGKAMQIVKGQKALAKTVRGKATRLQNEAEAAKLRKARSEAAKRAAATRAKNAKKK